jgi:putative endonuclease
MSKLWYTYILTSQKNWTLYVWVTSDLTKRLLQHKNKTYDWFTSRYNISQLVWFQECNTIQEAIINEKKIKWRTRLKKLQLIEQENPERKDLAEF